MISVSILFCIISSRSGWINGAQTYDADKTSTKNVAAAAMCFVSGAIFSVLAVLMIFLLKRVSPNPFTF